MKTPPRIEYGFIKAEPKNAEELEQCFAWTDAFNSGVPRWFPVGELSAWGTLRSFPELTFCRRVTNPVGFELVEDPDAVPQAGWLCYRRDGLVFALEKSLLGNGIRQRLDFSEVAAVFRPIHTTEPQIPAPPDGKKWNELPGAILLHDSTPPEYPGMTYVGNFMGKDLYEMREE